MKKKLKCILLIDDDYPTNHYHKIIIEGADCTEKVVAFQSGKKALEYLDENADSGELLPDLIFLDINMPVMNGWEFLNAYKQKPLAKSSKIVLMMLSTSCDPDDILKAETFEELSGFMSKPLSEELVETLVFNYFNKNARLRSA